MPQHQHSLKAYAVKQTGKKKAGKRSVKMPPFNEPQQLKGPSHASATSQENTGHKVRQAAGKGKR